MLENTSNQLHHNNLNSENAPDPLAIVGIGCRLPGASKSPDAFWENLLAGKDCIVDVPKNRWDVKKFYDENRNKLGKMHVKSGGFLQEKIDEFDALFFGISPREANSLDPQQRLLLEVSWEAFEDAGIDPDSLAGSNTGVFIGGFMMDNKLTQFSPLNRHTIASNTAVGMSLTMLSNRLSYTYDLRGPSISIDTACSSSMVALDQACRSIWTGDSNIALVGGVNVMHRPEVFIAMCKGGFLSPDGRCKSFDERADGYGRGEGAGIVVVKTLSEAERDGDQVYAIIRATGCNQDGHTDGITVPNPDSQRALIEKVSKKAQVALKDIQYFEAHGTGTPVGDPLEMSAIGGTVGQAKSKDETCIVGSVKGNIGHLEAASGIAAIIKSALSLKNKCVTPQANLINLNPNIPFDKLKIKIPLKIEPLNDKNGSVFAGINSFGYGGTNACAILESYQPTIKSQESQKITVSENQRYILPLSARSKPALQATAKNIHQWIEDNPNTSINNLTYSAGTRRAHLSNRLTVTANSLSELNDNLKQYINVGSHISCVEGSINEKRNKLVFVFTGMGPQWWAMGHELMASEPVFLASVKRSDKAFAKISGWSILAEMMKPEEETIITETQVAQTANFVLQVALVDLWDSWGITPSAIVGHSVGEVTTGYISGILTLEEALLVSYHRSRIQKKAAGQGIMLAVGLTEEQSLELIDPFASKVSIAAINAPSAITLAGDEVILNKLAEQLTQREVFNRLLQVEVPYHSPLMDPLLPEITECLAKLSPKTPKIATYSTVTGEEVTGTSFDGMYWCDNVRQPVYFFKAIEQMIADGYQDFLEIGPHPVLSSSIKECFVTSDIDGFLTASLKRKKNEQETIKEAIAELYLRGYQLNWAELSANEFIDNTNNSSGFKALKPEFIRLPSYPWQRDRYWNDCDISLIDRKGTTADFTAIGAKQLTPDNVWLSHVNEHFFEHLFDHKVEGLVVLAGATYIEAGLAAFKALSDEDACLISDLNLHSAMVIDNDIEPLMRTSYNVKDNSYKIHSYTNVDPNEATLHATGNIESLTLKSPHKLPIEKIKTLCIQELEAQPIYSELTARGLQYGPYFQGISHIWRRDKEVLAHIQPHPELELPADNYQLHPTLLDACFQSLISAIPVDSDFSEQVYVPVNIGQFRYYSKIASAFYCHGKLRIIDGHEIIGDITLSDENGNVLVEICDLRCQSLRQINQKTIENLDEWTYQPVWKNLDTLSPDINNVSTEHFILFVDNSETAKNLINRFKSYSSPRCTLVHHDDSATLNNIDSNATSFCLNGKDKAQLIALLTHIHSGTATKVIYAWSMHNEAQDPVHLAAVQSLLSLTQAMDFVATKNEMRLYVLTQDATKVIEQDKVTGFHQSALIGLGRVAAAELPNLKCTLIDISINLSAVTIEQVFAECLHDNVELEVAFRNEQRFAYRLANVSLAEAYQANTVTVNAENTFTLAKQGTVGNQNVNFQLTQPQAPRANELMLRISSVSLTPNSLNVQAMREVSAQVVNVGKDVTSFTTGDQIIAYFKGELSNVINIEDTQLLAIKKPTTWPQLNAAGSLSAYAVAYSGLNDSAQISNASNILVIGANSSIGQAAIKLAEKEKATVTSVGGENNKYNLNSSSLTPDLLQKNHEHGFEGFDIIINTAGEQANLNIDQLLADYGKYIKTTDDKKVQIRLSATKSQILLTRESALGGSKKRLNTLLSNLATEFTTGLTALSLTATPIATVDETNTPAQFNEQQPCVIDFKNLNAFKVVDKSSASITIKNNVSYLISGGFGGFGLGMAQWLVAQGAKSLILVSRSGASTDEAKKAVEAFNQQGVTVKSAAVDIANALAVEQLITEVKASMTPLAGIFHAAGVLDDKELLDIDYSSLQKVMLPKALGAWNLHHLTADLSLDCFVLYSSVSSMIGNRNQANYVAANLFLDNLAQYRQANGMAATSVNWGALADVGMAANNPSVINHLAHVGIHAFNQQQALEAFATLLTAPVAQLGIFNVDWQRWKQFEIASAHNRFSELISSDDKQDQGDLWVNLLNQDNDVLKPALIEKLSSLIADTLKLSEQQVDIETPINKFGLDSLMAMDLQMKFRNEFKVDVSILELMKGNSIIKLSDVIAQKLIQLDSQETDEQQNIEEDTAAVDELVDQISILSELSEEELDAMLAKELEAI